MFTARFSTINNRVFLRCYNNRYKFYLLRPMVQSTDTKEFYEAIAKNLANFVLLDNKGNVIYLNDFEGIIGYGVELSKKNWVDIIEDHEKEYFKTILEHSRKKPGIKVTAEYQVKTKKGKNIWLGSVLCNLNHNANVDGILMTFEDITDEKSSKQTLQTMAYYDNLIGITNNTLFHDRLKYAISDAQRNSKKCAILSIFIDSNREDNDEFLKKVGEKLKAAIRSNDTLSRMNGNQFASILVGISDIESAEFVCRKIIRTLAKPFEFHSKQVQINISIGISIYPDNSHQGEQLLLFADSALNAAIKEEGNVVKIYGSDM